MGQPLKGACLCGASTFTATPLSQEAAICHCSMCRKFSGGMFMVVDCSGQFTLDKDAPVTVFQSSEWGQRAFCSRCGSSLAWLGTDGKMAFVSVQAFENPSEFPLKHQMFIDCKPDSYHLADKTENMTEAEFLAMYAGNPEGDA